MAAKTKQAKPRKKAPAVRSRAALARSDAKTGQPKRRTLDGIPLRRKVVWVYDTDSPEFEAAMRRWRRAMKDRDADRDGMQFIEAALADADVQKWWR
jgi:hypothetical protein